jgi:transposase-like protein
MKKQVTKLLDEILAILKRDGKTIADLAKDLDRNYHQVYDWIRRRQFNPQADGLLSLMAWRDKHISPCAAKRRPRTLTTAQVNNKESKYGKSKENKQRKAKGWR